MKLAKIKWQSSKDGFGTKASSDILPWPCFIMSKVGFSAGCSTSEADCFSVNFFVKRLAVKICKVGCAKNTTKWHVKWLYSKLALLNNQQSYTWWSSSEDDHFTVKLFRWSNLPWIAKWVAQKKSFSHMSSGFTAINQFTYFL